MKKHLLSLICLTASFPFFAQTNNYSMQFDGMNDYIDFSSQVSVPSFPLTIQVDVKLPANFQQGEQFFVFQSDDRSGDYTGFWLTIHHDFVEISFGDGQGEGAQFRQSKLADHTIVFDRWVNIACIINGANDMKVYQDGIEITGPYDGGGGTYVADAIGGNTFSAHAVGTSASIFSEGKIDNQAIWSIELTQQEIQNYIVCPPTGNEIGLEAFWNFEAGSGTTAQDLTGNGHTGTLLNGPLWSTDTPPINCALVGIEEAPSLTPAKEKVLVEIVDILGRKVEFEYNTLQIYRYSDGSTEKVIVPKH
ncbi:MAG: hypothetical protein QE487_12355 [Fluviicola sp.]|nr:hypothetical protein [Fluviicola sp.]